MLFDKIPNFNFSVIYWLYLDGFGVGPIKYKLLIAYGIGFANLLPFHNDASGNRGFRAFAR
jgi:hypothetical protein